MLSAFESVSPLHVSVCPVIIRVTGWASFSARSPRFLNIDVPTRCHLDHDDLSLLEDWIFVNGCNETLQV